MKQILLVAVPASVLLSSATVEAQNDADNFYKSDRVNTKKVSFLDQYKMKVAGNY